MHRSFAVVALLAGACSPSEPEQVPFFDHAVEGQAGAPAFVVSDVVRGSIVSLAGTGLTPGLQLYFVVSAGGPGVGPCPPQLQGDCLGVKTPYWMAGNTTVDGTGIGSVNLAVPIDLPFNNVAFQGFAFNGGTYIGKSNVVIRAVEDLPFETDTDDTFNPSLGDTYDTDIHDTDPPAATSVQDLAAGDLVISEVMITSNECAGTLGQYVGVTNVSGLEVDLASMIFRSGSETFVVTDSIRVGPNEEAILWLNPAPAAEHCFFIEGFGVPYTGLTIDAGETLSIEGNLVVIDSVSTLSLPQSAGVAAELSGDMMNTSANDNPANWCAAPDPILGYADLGSPTGYNFDCP